MSLLVFSVLCGSPISCVLLDNKTCHSETEISVSRSFIYPPTPVHLTPLP